MTGPTDRYQRLTRIATGGMGEVWRARDSVLEREVALKLLKPEYADDPTFRERFATEARNAAGLLDPGIAAVFDYGEVEDEDGRTRPFLVMELVEGRPLSELIRPGEQMPPETARDLIGQAARALGVAHRAGLVHRDVKPGNLLVGTDGSTRVVKVTDFGIARAVDAVPLTQTGQILGTPHYLSPEQAEGASATAASDVYALGVVLFECLTGERPFGAESPVTTALAHVIQPVPDLPPGIPADLSEITRRALAKDPPSRFADGAEMAAALSGVDATQTLVDPFPEARTAGAVAGVPATAVLAGPRWYAGPRGRWALAGAGVLVVALVLALTLSNGNGTPGNRSTPTPTPTPRVAATKTPTQAQTPKTVTEPTKASKPHPPPHAARHHKPAKHHKPHAKGKGPK